MGRKKLTFTAWRDARENHIGWCRACGATQSVTEPGDREHECSVCGGHEVFGADEWIGEGWLEVVDDEGVEG